MKEEKPKFFKVRYTGEVRAETYGVGIMEPGEIKTVHENILEYLLNGWFELVEEGEEPSKPEKPGCKKQKRIKKEA